MHARVFSPQPLNEVFAENLQFPHGLNLAKIAFLTLLGFNSNKPPLYYGTRSHCLDTARKSFIRRENGEGKRETRKERKEEERGDKQIKAAHFIRGPFGSREAAAGQQRERCLPAAPLAPQHAELFLVRLHLPRSLLPCAAEKRREEQEGKLDKTLTDRMRTEFRPALDRWPLAPARHRAPQHLPGAAGTGSGAADRGGSAKHRRDPNGPASTNQSPSLVGGGGFSFPSNTSGQMLISPSAGCPPSSIAPVPAPPAARGVVASSAPQLLGFAWLKRCYHKPPPVAVLCHGHRHGNGLISYPTSAPCTCLQSLPLRDQEQARWGSLNLLPPSTPRHQGTMIQNAEQAGDLDEDTTPFSTQGGKSRHSASQASASLVSAQAAPLGKHQRLLPTLTGTQIHPPNVSRWAGCLAGKGRAARSQTAQAQELKMPFPGSARDKVPEPQLCKRTARITGGAGLLQM